MTVPEYPAELPRPESTRYTMENEDTFVRTQMSSGKARQRRRFTSVPTNVEVQWVFSDSEFELFEAWFRYKISDGADWFTGPLKTSTGLREDYEQRFSSMYRSSLIGPSLWQVRSSLELRDRQTASAEEVEFPLELIYSSLFDKTINRHWPDA